MFIILTVTMACSGFVYAGLTNTMPKNEMGLGDGLDTSYTQIGLLVGVVSGAASASGILGGWLADRFSARSIYLVFWMLQVPLLFVIASVTGASLMVVALLVLGFNLSFTAAQNMLVAQYTPSRWRSLAYGAKFVLALGVAGLTVIFAGRIFDSTGGFDLLYVWLGSAAIVAATGPAARLAPARPGARERGLNRAFGHMATGGTGPPPTPDKAAQAPRGHSEHLPEHFPLCSRRLEFTRIVRRDREPVNLGRRRERKICAR